jgi:hypothetical protein
MCVITFISYGCKLEQVTGEILVALEIQGSLKAHEGDSLNQRRQDRAVFGTDDANLAFVRVNAVWFITPGCLMYIH